MQTLGIPTHTFPVHHGMTTCTNSGPSLTSEWNAAMALSISTVLMQLPQAVDEVLTNSRKIHTRATLLSSGTNHKNLEHVVKNRERMRRIYNTSLQTELH